MKIKAPKRLRRREWGSGRTSEDRMTRHFRLHDWTETVTRIARSSDLFPSPRHGGSRGQLRAAAGEDGERAWDV